MIPRAGRSGTGCFPLPRGAGAGLRAEKVARGAGTIAYEVLSSIAPRVPRVYVG